MIEKKAMLIILCVVGMLVFVMLDEMTIEIWYEQKSYIATCVEQDRAVIFYK